MSVHLWAFVGIAGLIVTPGPDTVLVTKNAVLHGRRVALGTALGVNTGLLVWTVGAALGLAAVVREFASLLPQFVLAREPILVPSLLLGAVFVLMTLAWLCGYAVVAARVSGVLGRPSVKAALDRLTGVVLIGLGVRVALENRFAEPATRRSLSRPGSRRVAPCRGRIYYRNSARRW